MEHARLTCVREPGHSVARARAIDERPPKKAPGSVKEFIKNRFFKFGVLYMKGDKRSCE